jgi:hypothetical protein
MHITLWLKMKLCEVCGCDKDKCVCEEGCDSCGA